MHFDDSTQRWEGGWYQARAVGMGLPVGKTQQTRNCGSASPKKQSNELPRGRDLRRGKLQTAEVGFFFPQHRSKVLRYWHMHLN